VESEAGKIKSEQTKVIPFYKVCRLREFQSDSKNTSQANNKKRIGIADSLFVVS
jgi:hypothetical protein